MIKVAHELIKTYIEKIKEGTYDLVNNGNLVVILSKFHSEMNQNVKSQERSVADNKIRTRMARFW